MRVEVWAASPEPAVGAAWDRTGRGQVAGNRPGDGGEDQGVTLSSARSHAGSHGMNNLPVLRTRMDIAH